MQDMYQHIFAYLINNKCIFVIDQATLWRRRKKYGI
jgi:hypothetical protein